MDFQLLPERFVRQAGIVGMHAESGIYKIVCFGQRQRALAQGFDPG